MAVPWLRLLDTALRLTDLTLLRRSPAPAAEARADEQGSPEVRLANSSGGLGSLETRLAGVVVAALKEAFDRDSRRLEIERQQLEAERVRAERALRLELARQAGDREIGRLRLIAVLAAATWMGTLFFSPRLVGGALGARIALGCGWLLLLAGLATALAAQSRLADALGRIDEAGRYDSGSPVLGRLSPWLIIVGLAAVCIAALAG